MIGQSTRDGGEPAEDRVRMADLLATIMHTILDVGEVRVTDGLPSNLLKLVTRGGRSRGWFEGGWFHPASRKAPTIRSLLKVFVLAIVPRTEVSPGSYWEAWAKTGCVLGP